MAWIWKIKERVKIIFIAIVFNFLLNLILIKTMWVYWAALATWIWWFFIWLLSEYYLWKDYKIRFNIKNISKNIFILSIIWLLNYNYIIPLFHWLDRLSSLLFLFIISIIYFWIFTIINYSQFKFLVIEIKKLKKITKNNEKNTNNSLN
jgi:O-antigen/teichoic acid export membrane protein